MEVERQGMMVQKQKGNHRHLSCLIKFPTVENKMTLMFLMFLLNQSLKINLVLMKLKKKATSKTGKRKHQWILFLKKNSRSSKQS